MFDIFYVDEIASVEDACKSCRTRYLWILDRHNDYSAFDLTWEPPPWENEFCHVWPSQHQKHGNTRLIPKSGYNQVKYHNLQVPRLVSYDNWNIKDNPDWDYSWHPDFSEPSYVYHFGTQHQKTGGMVYTTPGATDIKFISNPMVKKTVDPNWTIPNGLDTSQFDFTWHPDATEQAYIYQFSTQHQKTGGPTYTVLGATEIKYVDSCCIKISQDQNWESTNFEDFDFTWHPDANDQPFIYQFGTQHQKTGGPRYIVPGATFVKYVKSPRYHKTSIDDYWEIPNDIEFTDFDYTWHPDGNEKPYIYQFGTQHQKTNGPRYVTPGATEVKFERTIKCTKTSIDDNWSNTHGLDNFDYTWHPDATDGSYIYQFGTQWQKTGGPTYTVPGATEIKFVHKPRAEKTSIDDNWHVPDVDFGEFDYTWHPDNTDDAYIYQFGTQWQKTGGPQYIVPGATQTKYVDQIKIKAEKFASAAIVIDHFDGNLSKVIEQVEKRLPVIKTSRYFDNYLGTITRILQNAQEYEYIWILSSVCDYTNFDFSWHPETWQSTMLHVFASNEQKFGDTFFVHVPTFLARIDEYELLEWYDCNFVEDISVPRHPLPIVTHEYDTHVECIPELNFKSPLIILSTRDKDVEYPTVNLWQAKTKTIVPLSEGATSVILPRVAVPYIKKQFYDYPYIDKTHKINAEDCLDIVFISNGESNAEQNWKHLKNCTKDLPNRVVRVDGVNGRAEAYRAAVDASETNWAFCVFAKLEVDPGFDWSWQPDRLQNSKHYIFHAENPVNGLTYGHMAMIAYNKKLVMDTVPSGLDFTLDSEHEVVPILSGVAQYAHDPWIAWRSAFRECIKLYHSLPDIDNEWRLQQWLNVNLLGNSIGAWSIQGATDAIEYYDSVQGSFEALRLTYEWDWLSCYLKQKHNLSPDQLCTQFRDQ